MSGSNMGFAALLDNLPAAVIRLDRELRYLYANRAAAEMFGIARESLLGRTTAEIGALRPEVCRAAEEKYHAVLAAGRPERHRFRCFARGALRHYTVQIVPEFGANGAVEALLSVAADITEDGAQHGQTDGATAPPHAFDEDPVKGEFLADVSHELRTPLNAILGWAQTIQATGTSEETRRRALAQIEQSAHIQARLIEDLLNVSDIIAGRLSLDTRPMRLVAAVNAAVESLSSAINARGIALDTVFDPAADVIRGDPARIEQILWNLLAHAVKFTPQQGAIRVALARAGAHASVIVSGSGAGMLPEFAHHALDRLPRGEAATGKRHGGLSLGLTLARRLVELHGGTIEARRGDDERDSALIVRLPLDAAPGQAHPNGLADGIRTRSSPFAAHARRRSLAGVSILAVDDDSNTRDLLHEVLERVGAAVHAAASAREALAKLQQQRPDILLSDIGMPGEDGCDLLRQIRALPEGRGGATPAIALTGYSSHEDRVAARAAGYQAIATKPVDLDRLISTILEVARKARLLS